MSGVIGAVTSFFTGGPIGDILGPVITKVLDFIPDPAEKARQAQALTEAVMDADQKMIAAQNAINLAEAQSDNIFKSGWRPYVGWACGFGLSLQIIIFPFAQWGTALFGYHPALPTIDSGLITSYLVPLLGLGAYRSYEKVNNATNANTKTK